MKFAKNFTPLAVLVLVASFYAIASAQSTNNPGDYFESSFAYENAGNVDKALKEIAIVLRMDPNHYIANYRAAWLYYLQGNYDEAIRLYKKAASIADNAIEPRLALLLPLTASQNWAEAERLGKQLVAEVPNNYYANSRLAFIYFSEEKYAEAEKHYRKALDNYPSEIEMMLGLGWTYLKQGKKEKSREMFEKVLRIRPSNLNAQAGLEAL